MDGSNLGANFPPRPNTLGRSVPAFPTLFFGAQNYTATLIAYTRLQEEFVVRFEGVLMLPASATAGNGTNGMNAGSAPDLIVEVSFFADGSMQWNIGQLVVCMCVCCSCMYLSVLILMYVYTHSCLHVSMQRLLFRTCIHTFVACIYAHIRLLLACACTRKKKLTFVTSFRQGTHHVQRYVAPIRGTRFGGNISSG